MSKKKEHAEETPADSADKHPRLRAMYEELQVEKAKILKAVAPARETYEELINDPRLIKARKVIKENNKRLGEIDTELAALARALGAKGMKLEPGVYTSS